MAVLGLFRLLESTCFVVVIYRLLHCLCVLPPAIRLSKVAQASSCSRSSAKSELSKKAQPNCSCKNSNVNVNEEKKGEKKEENEASNRCSKMARERLLSCCVCDVPSRLKPCNQPIDTTPDVD